MTSAVRVPPKLERVLDRADQGNLTVETEVSDANRVYDRLAKRLIYGMLLGFSLLAGSVLFVNGELIATAVLAGFATAVSGLLWWSYRKRRRGIRARPQFTRQAMRERQETAAGDRGIAVETEE